MLFCIGANVQMSCLIWGFFFIHLMIFFQCFDEIQSVFFPLFFCKIFVSCFFKKKRKVFLLLICKKKVLWMNWIVCWLSCRRICFFFLIPIFLNGIKKKIIVWKKFFMCLFSFIVNMDEKKISRQNKRVWKKGMFIYKRLWYS